MTEHDTNSIPLNTMVNRDDLIAFMIQEYVSTLRGTGIWGHRISYSGQTNRLGAREVLRRVAGAVGVPDLHEMALREVEKK